VRIDGESEVFTVLRVDRERHLADLLRDGPVRKMETGVPIASLIVVGEPGEVKMTRSA